MNITAVIYILGLELYIGFPYEFVSCSSGFVIYHRLMKSH